MSVAETAEEDWLRLVAALRGEAPIVSEGSQWLALRYRGEDDREEQAQYIKVALVRVLNMPHVYIAAHAGPVGLLPALVALRWNHELEIGALVLEQEHWLLAGQLPLVGAAVERVCSVLAYFRAQLRRIRSGLLTTAERGPEPSTSVGCISHWAD